MRTEYGKEIEQEVKEKVTSLKEELGYTPEKLIWFYRGYISGKIGTSKLSLEDCNVIDEWLVDMLDGGKEEEK